MIIIAVQINISFFPDVIRPSNIKPNITTTYVDLVVLCSNEARPEEICSWKSLEMVGNKKPMWSFLGAALVVHKVGTFAFQCRCVDPELKRETNLPWSGEIRILPRGGRWSKDWRLFIPLHGYDWFVLRLRWMCYDFEIRNKNKAGISLKEARACNIRLVLLAK